MSGGGGGVGEVEGPAGAPTALATSPGSDRPGEAAGSRRAPRLSAPPLLLYLLAGGAIPARHACVCGRTGGAANHSQCYGHVAAARPTARPPAQGGRHFGRRALADRLSMRGSHLAATAKIASGFKLGK